MSALLWTGDMFKNSGCDGAAVRLAVAEGTIVELTVSAAGWSVNCSDSHSTGEREDWRMGGFSADMGYKNLCIHPRHAYTNDWLGLVDGKDTLIEGGEENAEWKEERVGECAVRTLQPV
ncbi:unnamed protein product [Pleuronectes platessa]|uniref:Uncharacterized protein n=1 Tax=Pleuronectes platessa TaxID=8262 RepID=A0A9N7VEA3_PLEPL|nr:unnamed protein product [Pleuronectes platessa]